MSFGIRILSLSKLANETCSDQVQVVIKFQGAEAPRCASVNVSATPPPLASMTRIQHMVKKE